MKTIQNKQINLAKDVQAYSDLIRICVATPGQEGMDLDTMRRRLRILDAVEKSTDTISIEDSDMDILKACVAAMRWNVVHAEIVKFADCILEDK